MYINAVRSFYTLIRLMQLKVQLFKTNFATNYAKYKKNVEKYYQVSLYKDTYAIFYVVASLEYE